MNKVIKNSGWKSALDAMVILLFCGILLVPLVMLNREEEAVSTIDKRKLAEDPFTAYKFNHNFTDSVDAYFNDRIGFRNEMIEFHSELLYHAFHISGNPSVIVGKDGWLFYNSEEDDRRRVLQEKCYTVGQFLGTKLYTKDQIQQIADNLQTTKKYVESHGAKFILFIAPNKERIYDEKMPNFLLHDRISNQCDTNQIVEYLKNNTNIDVVYPYEELKKYIFSNPNVPVYYKLDTHWNNLGAYIGARELLEKGDIFLNNPSNIGFQVKNLYEGDLLNMMGLVHCKQMSDIDIELDSYPNEGVTNGEEYGRFINKGRDKRKILVVGDSFRLAMQNVIASEFNESYFMHEVDFNIDDFKNYEPDIFVYELSERYDDRLLNFKMDIDLEVATMG